MKHAVLSRGGQTSGRFRDLSSGPVGPPVYLAVAAIPNTFFCRGSESGYC